jgi:hypothetical protein
LAFNPYFDIPTTLTLEYGGGNCVMTYSQTFSLTNDYGQLLSSGSVEGWKAKCYKLTFSGLHGNTADGVVALGEIFMVKDCFQ